MKKYKLPGIVLSVLLLTFCGQSPKQASFMVFAGDTINRSDEKGRQGNWIVFDTAYKPNSNNTKSLTDSLGEFKILEEGFYKDGKRHGTWTYYDAEGYVREVVEYDYGNEVGVSSHLPGGRPGRSNSQNKRR